MKIFRTTALALVTAAVATTAYAYDGTVAEIDVKTELSDFANSNALEYWPDLEKDLSIALANRLKLEDVPNGDRLVVTISDINLNGNPTLPQTGEFNQLEGAVVLYDYGDETRDADDNGSTTIIAERSFPLRLSAVAGDVIAPADTIVIPPSKDDFYTALVNGFADATVDNLD
ncbi:hypothetical protein N6L24_03100 [Cognatishimia sp. SS12]|uniref:hypothetical protein n=1 Tax=Cognatishimia sp. SS12 TaxID=2979465 RepID=UPI0023314892|nr:hypothetical protein [Cognatishimia sp. SS12]MDC0737253.1 hypothetical protein [Cognatishimia sp. SS12]